MLVRIVGGHGGVSPGFKATSYLIDGKLLIDAGSCASNLLIDEQKAIDHILISHPHLDHIKDLAFICDNCFGIKKDPFEVFTNQTVTDQIMMHLFNETIWPDFTKLPSREKPTIRFNIIKEREELILGDYKIIPVNVNHPSNALGFIIQNDKSSIVFTQDTGPTEEIWEVAKGLKNLKAIFSEVSFPNHLKAVATASQHHTPFTLNEEIKKMPPDVPIFVGHIKPNYQTQLFKEIEELGNDRVVIMGMDDANYVF